MKRDFQGKGLLSDGRLSSFWGVRHMLRLQFVLTSVCCFFTLCLPYSGLALDLPAWVLLSECGLLKFNFQHSNFQELRTESIYSLVYIIPLALALQHTLLMVSVPFLTMHFFAIPIQQYQNSFFCFQHSETLFYNNSF